MNGNINNNTLLPEGWVK